MQGISRTRENSLFLWYMASTLTPQTVKFLVRFYPYSPFNFTYPDLYIDVFQKRPTTPTMKIHAISYLKDHAKSCKYTVSVLRVIVAKTRAEIAKLGGNVGLDRIMDLLHVDETTII